MRTREFPMGLPELSVADQRRVEVGNRTLYATVYLVHAGLRVGLPMLLENPCTSRLWSAPKLQRTYRHGYDVIFDQCQFG